MIDTHSHIYLEQFDEDREQIISGARTNGLSKILLPNIDSSSIEAMLTVSDAHPLYCLPMMGLHPTSVKEDYIKELEIAEQWFEKRNFIGIGEIGMDLYWDSTFKKEQEDALRVQLRWAAEMQLPVSLHTRSAFPEIFQVIERHYDSRLKGVFHSFSGSIEDARKVLQLPDFYLGINGTVTYKNSTLPAVLAETGYDRVVLETDAPYLPPVPYRGKRNEPAYLLHVRYKLADIFGVSSQTIEEVTDKNAAQLFRLTP